MTAEQALHDYLTRIAEFCKNERCLSLEGFVLEHGIMFEPSPALPEGFELGEEKQCYMNATRLAIDADLSVSKGNRALRYIYVEGFAISQKLFDLGVPIAMQHAWVANEVTGEVVDNTWGAGAAYFGIPFTTKFLLQQMEKTGYYGIFPGFGRPTIPPKAIYKFPDIRK